MLRIFTNNNQNEWAHHLWRVEHAFNHSPTSTMGRTPHEIQFGHIPRMLPATSTSNVPAVNEYLEQQEVDNAVARDSLLAARYRQAAAAARRRNTKNPFEVGQMAFYKKLTREKGKIHMLHDSGAQRFLLGRVQGAPHSFDISGIEITSRIRADHGEAMRDFLRYAFPRGAQVSGQGGVKGKQKAAPMKKLSEASPYIVNS
jgi:hypothetical protein